MADVGRILVTRHPEGSEEGVREKRRRPAEHRSQRLWEKRERGLYVRVSASDLPGTPERALPRSTSWCTRSRFWVISFRISRCRSRNRCPSYTDWGGFLLLSVSAALSRVCRQYLIASCASSSKIAGCSHCRVRNSAGEGPDYDATADLYELVELREHPDRLLQSGVPRFLLVPGLDLENPADTLLLPDVRSRHRLPRSFPHTIRAFAGTTIMHRDPPTSLSGYARSSGLGT